MGILLKGLFGIILSIAFSIVYHHTFYWSIETIINCDQTLLEEEILNGGIIKFHPLVKHIETLPSELKNVRRFNLTHEFKLFGLFHQRAFSEIFIESLGNSKYEITEPHLYFLGIFRINSSILFSVQKLGNGINLKEDVKVEGSLLIAAFLKYKVYPLHIILFERFKESLEKKQ